MEAAGGNDEMAACPLPEAAGGAGEPCCRSGTGRLGGSVRRGLDHIFFLIDLGKSLDLHGLGLTDPGESTQNIENKLVVGKIL